MERKLSTWVQLFGHRFEDAYNLDPTEELDITPDQRESLNEVAKKSLLEVANDELKLYGRWVLGNGDIMGDNDSLAMNAEQLADTREAIEMWLDNDGYRLDWCITRAGLA